MAHTADDASRFFAVKKWNDGDEKTEGYFPSRQECSDWIDKQPQPADGYWEWYVAEY